MLKSEARQATRQKGSTSIKKRYAWMEGMSCPTPLLWLKATTNPQSPHL